MTTKSSPRQQLEQQANKIAYMLKRFERGETIEGPFTAKLEQARRTRSSIKFGIFMDDKVVTVEMPWSLIAETSHAGLVEWIVQQMQEKPTDG